MGNTNYKIKQILPVPDNVSAVIRICHTEDGKEYWEDANKNGWIVGLALVEDEEGNTYVLPYSIDGYEGFCEIHDNADVGFYHAQHCEKCGHKMWVSTHRYSPAEIVPVEYECECGITARDSRRAIKRPYSQKNSISAIWKLTPKEHAISYGAEFTCSACGHSHFGADRFRYCCMCGAKMENATA